MYVWVKMAEQPRYYCEFVRVSIVQHRSIDMCSEVLMATFTQTL